MNLFSRIRGIVTIAVVLCLMLALAYPVTAETSPTVLMFDVEGNTRVPAEKILGAISNTKIGDPFDVRKVEADMKSIMALGYFSDINLKTEKMFDGVKVVFEVVENPTLKEIQLIGLTKVKQEELKTFFTQKTGDVFSAAVFRDDLSKALKYCRETKGLFIEPKSEGQISISADGVVRVELVELKYGKIVIKGLEKTKESVILRELSIREGDIINYNELKEDYMNIMRLRLFDGVEPRLEKSVIPNSYDVIFEVKEAQTGSFSFGVTFGQSDGKVGGVLGYSEGNLMGLGQNISLDLNFSESEQNAQFSFYEPWLDSKHTSFGVSMWNTDNNFYSTLSTWYPGDAKDYYIHLIETGLSLSFGRPLGKDTRGTVRFSFQRDNIPTGDILDSDDGNSVSLGDPALPTEFWDNSVGLNVTKNRLSYQDRNFVDGGYQLSADYSVAGRYLGGEFNYQKGTLEGKWFHSFSPNLVLGTRLQGSLVSGDYPDYDALYLGGMYKLRGYADQRFDNNISKQLIGDQYLLSNTELRYRLPSNKSLEFVVFYDAGQINNNIGGGSSFKSDYGIGIRYNIPLLGVLRLDQAWNTDKGDGNRLVFSLGEMF
ncbi:Beta-barrel assembly machine subunit BamA [Hydrogenispora ethanolica]|uniref:Beta-barrel assembly machine subunit BamA n=1 Tax=Hydrogenispora ethanolica TaxID=1082276 RepID=A0A4V2QCY7_HYDET|nr:BamA/TamA family outer membrane protein [Hydrogenispora ethanolica]TCL62207.1 Beta-barrel assembly machine subunit BamA [Hydrogenispora ethanolica]